jgi:hypothetical protein
VAYDTVDREALPGLILADGLLCTQSENAVEIQRRSRLPRRIQQMLQRLDLLAPASTIDFRQAHCNAP